MPGFNTSSGGKITLDINRSGIYGSGLWMEVDQSANINTADDSASIVLSNGEVRNLIDLFHDYLRFVEGKDYFKKISDIEAEKLASATASTP